MGLQTTKPSVGMGVWILPEKHILNPFPHLHLQICNIYILHFGFLVLKTSLALWFWEVYN